MEETAETYFKRGLEAFKAFRSHEAILYFERARALNAHLPGLDLAYVKALRRDARYAQALAFAPTQSIDPAERCFERAMCLLALGDAPSSLAAFDQALAARPDMAVAWLHSHAPALALIGFDEAIRRIEKARSCSGPVNGNYAALLAAYHWFVGQEREATALARKGRHRILIDGMKALKPKFAADIALFSISARLLEHALDAAKTEGLVLEFGVRRGASLRQIAKHAKQQVHGFDSFEGLPQAWGKAGPGLLSTGAELPETPANATLHPGWFEDALPRFLQDHSQPARFVNIDSDIYASAKTVLTLLAPRLRQGSVIVFDELIGNPTWKDDEYKALCEFERDHGLRCEVFAISPATKQAALRVL